MMVDIRSLLKRPPAAASGKRYWRSLDQLHDTPEFRAWIENEFPAAAGELDEAGPNRRRMLQLMAASFGLAGLTACRRPQEHVLPFAKAAEGYVHGKPKLYATAMSLNGAATGLLVEVNDGRPTKAEGNPDHPWSLGAASAFHQASILGLYDPDRSRTPLHLNREARWEDFAAAATQCFAGAGQGEKLRFLSEPFHSPSLDMVKAFALARWPRAKWVDYDPLSQEEAVAGAVAAFSQPLQPIYNFDQADVIVALDADFLGLDSTTPRPTKLYARRRKVEGVEARMNRLYVVESQHSSTGANADHRLRLRAGEIQAFAADLTRAVMVALAAGPNVSISNQDGTARGRFLWALARDLAKARSKGLVVAGPRQPAAVHALAYALNQSLGSIGTALTFVKGVDSFTPQLAALTELAGEMAAGQVDTLVMLGGNPVFTAPADLDFAASMKKVATTIHLGVERDETAVAATWHLPMAHYLESWGDGRAPDGTASIAQPLIEPLYGGRTASELLALVSGYKHEKAHDIVHNYWLAQFTGDDPELEWRKALRSGVVPNTAAPQVKPAAAADPKKLLASASSASAPAAASGFEVMFVASACAWDGRFANNGWLQEAPEPMTKLTWGNAALVSPATARELGFESGDVVSIERHGRKLEIPVFVQPGHADRSFTVALGYGRTVAGRVAAGVGSNAYAIRSSDAFGFGAGFQVIRTGAKQVLAATVDHHSIPEAAKDDLHKRVLSIVKEGTLEEFKKNPHFVEEGEAQARGENLQLYPRLDYSQGHQWGMAVDLNSCVGCNACVLACVAENNTPIVGQEQVIRGREMHWIRIDRYYAGEAEDPTVLTQPMACQQCENAPCENVCPVAATTHSPEGLNDMAYNRCVGTRYCANNCPYKVRRFNFFDYHKNTPETVKMAFNPDVTVRMRGVMEKCTYCVQRIQEVKIQAHVEGRRAIQDGEITPACAQTCPADAIVFGDINDPVSRVARLRGAGRNYPVLGDLNTRPRTTYLAKLRNPNPELENHG